MVCGRGFAFSKDSQKLVYRNQSDGKLTSLDPKEVVGLPKYQAFARVREDVLQLRMHRPPAKGSPERAREVVANSRRQYGVPIGESAAPRSTSGRATPAESTLEDIDPGDVFGA